MTAGNARGTDLIIFSRRTGVAHLHDAVRTRLHPGPTVWLGVVGYMLAGMFLVYGVIEALSVTADQTFGHRSDPAQSTAMVPVFAILAAMALVPLVLFLGAARGRPFDSVA